MDILASQLIFMENEAQSPHNSSLKWGSKEQQQNILKTSACIAYMLHSKLIWFLGVGELLLSSADSTRGLFPKHYSFVVYKRSQRLWGMFKDFTMEVQGDLGSWEERKGLRNVQWWCQATRFLPESLIESTTREETQV